VTWRGLTSTNPPVASPGKESGQGEGEEEGEEEEGGEDEAAAILQLALHALWAPNSGGGFSDPAAAVAATAGTGSGGQPQRVQLQLRALAAERDEAALAAARAEAATQRLLKGAAAMRTFFTQKVSGSALDLNCFMFQRFDAAPCLQALRSLALVFSASSGALASL